MKTKILLALFIGLLSTHILAQNEIEEVNVEEVEIISYDKPERNIIKVNLPSLAVTTFSFQYEYFPINFLSLSLGYKFTPKRGMVFKDKVINLIEDSSDVGQLDDPGTKFFEHFEFHGNAITPEVRFYLGEGYGKGFYLGPFLRFDNYKFNSVYLFEGVLDDYDIDFDGKYKGFGYGLNIGAQYRIGKFTIDTFLGPYFSNVKIDFNSKSQFDLTEIDKENLLAELQDFELPNGKTHITVDRNSVRAKLTADNFINLRFGLGIGYRF